jgi:hypothetical protein
MRSTPYKMQTQDSIMPSFDIEHILRTVQLAFLLYVTKVKPTPSREYLSKLLLDFSLQKDAALVKSEPFQGSASVASRLTLMAF